MLLAFAIAFATAIATRTLGIDANQSQVLELALGVFGGFASALTFALALLATTVTLWPPVTALILRPPLLAWAALSVLSVATSFVDSFAHHPIYVVIALASTTAAAAVGTGALVEVLSVVGGSERIRFHGRVLGAAVRRASGTRTGAAVDGSRRLCGDFLSAAATYASTDTTDLLCTFEILINAADAFVDDDAFRRRGEGEAVLRLLLEFQMLLPASMRRGEALDETAMLLERASGQVAVISGRLQGQVGVDGPTPACWLAAQTRTHNWTAVCVAAIAEQAPELAAQCERVISRVRQAQTIISRCVDPDPPLEVIPTRHPWHLGVRDDPMGLMVWYSTAFEYHGILDNNAALYVAHESLLGRKTTGDYNYGYVLRDLEDGVRKSESIRQVFLPHGGFTELLVDVLAGCLATCSPGRWKESQNHYAGEGWVTDDARARAAHVAWIVPKGSEEPPSADGVLGLVVGALSRGNHVGFERYRRLRLDALGCDTQPPWGRVLETPIFHLAAGALMLASWARDPIRELTRFGDRLGPAGRRASKAVLDEVLRADRDLDQVRESSLDTKLDVTAADYAGAVAGYVDGLR